MRVEPIQNPFGLPTSLDEGKPVVIFPATAGGGRRVCCRCMDEISEDTVYTVQDPWLLYQDVCRLCANGDVFLRVWQARCDAGNAIEAALRACPTREHRSVFMRELASDAQWFANWAHPVEEHMSIDGPGQGPEVGA